MMLKMMLKALTVFACIATVQGGPTVYRMEDFGGDMVTFDCGACMMMGVGVYDCVECIHWGDISASVCGTGTKLNDAKTGCVAAVTCGAGAKLNADETSCVAITCGDLSLLNCALTNGCSFVWATGCTADTGALTSGVDDGTALDGNALVGRTASGAADTGGGGNDVPVSWASETVAVCAVLITIFLAMLVCVNVSNARLQRVDADDEDAGGNGAYQGGVTSVASVSEL